MTFKAAFYKGTRPGFQGLYSRAVRGWEKGNYSHCELIFNNGRSASSSYTDGGVRFKQIEYDPEHWDFIDLPQELHDVAYHWFINAAIDGIKYDLRANFHFVFGPISEDRNKRFCSEAMMEALGFSEAWRFTPNNSYPTLKRLFK